MPYIVTNYQLVSHGPGCLSLLDPRGGYVGPVLSDTAQGRRLARRLISAHSRRDAGPSYTPES